MTGSRIAVPAQRRGRRAARVHGVVAVDKPVGMTSFAVVREVRRRLDERRVGHAGTLDPAASGLLPVCVGAATRLVDYFHQQDKAYRCTVRLGERSDTMDTEGTVVRGGDASGLGEGAVAAAVAGFVGEIEQLPPMHSAVRHEGRHLYELARAGIVVERRPRTARIVAITVLAIRPGQVAEVDLDVVCGKGAYMRVLAHDLGEALGVGGLLGGLRRTRYGTLTAADAVAVDAVSEAVLLPMAVAVDHLPRLDLPPQQVTAVRRGGAVWVTRRPEGLEDGGEVRVHEPRGGLVALGSLHGLHLRPTKVLGTG